MIQSLRFEQGEYLTRLANAMSRNLGLQGRPSSADGTFSVVLDDVGAPHFFAWIRPPADTAGEWAARSIAWRSALADTMLLPHLVNISGDVRDRRLYATLLAVARDSSRAVPVRVAAIDAVAPLLHPALYWFRTAGALANTGNSCSAWGFFSHEAVQEEGAEPMGVGSRRAGVAELSRLGREDVPPPVREAALTVSRCAAHLLDQRAPQTW